ncbi:MAG: small ribosomal subunit Rsm22 family protein [Blastocatellia bacterium]
MQLPESLQFAIKEQAATVELKKLRQAAEDLSTRYRLTQNTPQQFIMTAPHSIAYITTRLPATFAAVTAVLREVKARVPNYPIRSLLDLGAGPGTAAWAAQQIFPDLQRVTMVERDQKLMQIGQQMASHSREVALRTAEWRGEDLQTCGAFPPHDLVIASYSLGELLPEWRDDLLRKAWEAASKAIVLVEPGTTKSFALLREIRASFLEQGGQLIAPCPHHAECPLSKSDWCHFAARVERTALHRKLKEGLLSFEDEKYSYLAIAKGSVTRATARVLRRPNIKTGFVAIKICTPQGETDLTVTRSQKEQFKRARKINWGDAWE